MSLADVFSSQTFRRHLWGTLIVSALLALFLVFYHFMLVQEAEQVKREVISEHLTELSEQIADDGLAMVIEEYSEEFGPLWPAEEAQYVLEEGGVLLLVLQSDLPVLGFPELLIERGWHDFRYATRGELWESIDILISAYRVDLNDGLSVVGALPADFAQESVASHMFALWSLWLSFFILSLVVVYLVSRYVLGRVQALSASVSEMAAGDLNVHALVSSAEDEFDQVAMDINQMLHQIRRLMRNLEDVSVGAAHDLKTPLTRLDQRLQRILHDRDDPEEIKQHVEAASQNVQTLLTTFNALLRLGEIESGRLRTHFIRHDLSALVQDVAETYEAVFSEQGRQLDISVVPNIEVMGDQDLIAQQISNLLENVLEHTDAPTGGWIRLQGHADGALLQIGDHGPGIPLAEHDKVFDRFYRVDKSRTNPGNGLGLSLVGSIANIHGAEVSLHAKQPGTVIDITFPNI